MGIIVGVVHPTATADIIIITPILHLTFSDNLLLPLLSLSLLLLLLLLLQLLRLLLRLRPLLCTSVQSPTPRPCLMSENRRCLEPCWLPMSRFHFLRPGNNATAPARQLRILTIYIHSIASGLSTTIYRVML